MVKVHKSLDNKGLLINKDAKITVLDFDNGQLFLFIMGRFYLSHFRDDSTHCKLDCSIFYECVGAGHSLCIDVYNLIRKRTGPRLYFTELKLSLFLSKLFVRSLKWK